MVMDVAQLREEGDWVVHLKTLLGVKPNEGRVVAQRPRSKHRATRKAVKMLTDELPKGFIGTPAKATMDDIKKVVFNAVDQLIDEKVEKTKRGKTRLQALDKFREVLETDFAKAAKKDPNLDPQWKQLMDEALRALRQEAMEDLIKNGNESQEQQKQICHDMALTEEGRIALGKDPALAQQVLAKVDIDWLNKNGTCARVMQKLWQAGNYDEICALIQRGADTSLPARMEGTGAKNRKNGDYSGFVQPLEHVIATRLRDVALLDADECSFADAHKARNEAAACPSAKDHEAGIEAPGCKDDHKHQHDIKDTGCPLADQHEPLLKNTAGPFTDERKSQARGAKKIFAALGSKAVSMTSWSDVQDSDMIKAFNQKPGTIWGFEDVRYPYVQAAHEQEKGAQPLRMMELWETVEQALFQFEYNELLTDPDKTIKTFVDKGLETIEKGISSGDAKYASVAANKDEFLRNFERDATAFLKEMAQQMPKGGFGVGKALDDQGRKRKDVGSLGEVAGLDSSKFMAGMACKAGLWWAKAEGKPVYYCLDGINMDDVTSYKQMKNKAIEDFIDNGGTQGKAKKHSEVITMVEVREILKNWDELKDTVIFVLKGKVLSAKEAEECVNGTGTGQDRKPGWVEQMKQGDTRAGRTPAPPRENFVHDLNAINPGLMALLPKGMEGDMDARDLVKKFNYLVRVSNVRPGLVLKYIMSRCKILVTYHLIPEALVNAAAALMNAEREKAPATEVKRLGEDLLAEIAKCHDKLKAPLKAALIRHPLLV